MAVRLDPQAVAEQALGGSEKPGAADAAARVLVALTAAGWGLVHRDAPQELVGYAPKQTTIEGEAR